MFDKIPPIFIKIIIAGVVLASPVTVFTFMFAGLTPAIYVLIGWMVFFVVLYMIVVRKYVLKKLTDADEH